MTLKVEESKQEIDDSKQLDPDDFVMSNTSLSIHGASQVNGLDTDRGEQLTEMNESQIQVANQPDFDSTYRKLEIQ